MKILKFTFLFLMSAVLFTACNKDDDDGMTMTNPDEECPLSGVYTRLDEDTSLGLMDVAYDSTGQIESAGLQTYDMTYDADGKLVRALLDDGFSPRVEFQYSYNAAGQITEVKSIWGEGANAEERYVYTPTYDSNGFIDMVARTGFLPDDLDYDFDSNGNVLKWTDPVFDDYSIFTFDDSQKGIVEGLDHTQAFAYGLAINQPFFHFNNAVTSETTYEEDGTVDEENVFTDLQFSDAGFQTIANNPDGKQYEFEYECN